MEKLFSISETAKMVNMTAETLRHYDRVGLCHPYNVDEWTGYRYYSAQEIVRLNTISALKSMDLSLQEIQKILDFNDFNRIIDFLNKAEKSANEKIANLKEIKKRIQRAKLFYETKSANKDELGCVFVQELSERVIMIAPELSTPTISNLYDYHRHFYAQIDDAHKNDFAFEDLAGVIEENGKTKMFAVCTKYKNHPNLRTLPKGKYLCENCTEENREKTLKKLLSIAKNQYNKAPQFTIQIVVLTGILQWNYQIQVPLLKHALFGSFLIQHNL